MSRADVIRSQIAVANCSACPLTGSNVAMVSPATAAFAVLGEAPGQREVQRGVPFVGPAGRLLRKALERAGIDPDAGAWLNTVSCLPDRNPPEPTGAEVAACTPNRVRQLAASEAEVVLAVGATALRVWRTDVSIGTAWAVPLVRGETVIIPSVHPAAVLRDEAQRWKLNAAIEKLALLVNRNADRLVGRNLLGDRCLGCNQVATRLDADCWPWCHRCGPKELTAKQRAKKLKEARVRANERRQGVMF